MHQLWWAKFLYDSYSTSAERLNKAYNKGK